MNAFSVVIITIACFISIVRIAFISVKIRNRKREIAECEAADRIIFHEEIDDVCLRSEIKKELTFVFGIFVFPLSWIDVWICSYAGTLSKTLSAVSIFAGYFFIFREIENRQA